ncbi:hypothetical protein JNL27_14575 [bacterium]|nr:hypothetical protein [bacterium]
MAKAPEINANELLTKMEIEVKTDKLFGFRLLVLEFLCYLICLICKINLTIEHDFDEVL